MDEGFFEFTQAREKCLRHARRLARSGELIFKAGGYNIAFHLGLLSLEESGKIFMFFAKYKDQSASSKWIDIKNHVLKITWVWVAALNDGGEDLEVNAPRVAETSALLHEIRQMGLYVDAKASTDPVKVISAKLAKSVLMLAYSVIMLEEDRVWGPDGNVSLGSYLSKNIPGN